MPKSVTYTTFEIARNLFLGGCVLVPVVGGGFLVFVWREIARFPRSIAVRLLLTARVTSVCRRRFVDGFIFYLLSNCRILSYLLSNFRTYGIAMPLINLAIRLTMRYFTTYDTIYMSWFPMRYPTLFTQISL